MFIGVAWIWGFEFTFQSGEIFGKIGDWMRARLPEWILKPLFDCRYCMSSIHGTFIFCLFLWGWVWWTWVIFCFCLCGITAIFDNK